MNLKEALEKKTSSIKDSYEFDYLECMEYIDLLESIVLLQDEALDYIKNTYSNDLGPNDANYVDVVLRGTAEQTQSEILKMLQPESER